MGRYLERYRAGECQQVWAELLAEGAAVREGPLASDAWAVAQETMRRVRHNIELLIPRLQTLGYRFGKAQRLSTRMVIIDPSRLDEFIEDYFTEYPVFQPPSPETTRLLDELEQRVGLLPLSLRAFYLEVGGVNLTGMPPWAPRVLDYDPLFIFPLTELLQDVEMWSQDGDEGTAEAEQREESAHEGLGEAGDTDLWLSPDAPQKFRVSGGDPYTMTTPNANIDGVFHDGYHDVTFVEYLRLCFRSGGLTDLEREEHAQDNPFFLHTPVPGVAEALAYLRRDLLPI
jgi:hypothetical protein